ncbi:MAG: DUF488 domain-containing protein [Halofilum sp. (in: g-proteobacteria)]|nr:DUF488 domain-containing protein [Halofilum sp. (in: g-proteobacteria)]
MYVRIKRIYDPPADHDGARVLVDRVWPRGVRKADAALDEWCRDAAPSTGLRKWFGHDPARFDAFARHYRDELAARPETVDHLRALARADGLTLLYAARDPEHNHARVLAAFLAGQGHG